MSFSPIVQALVDEFHPPLSPTLIATISSDHDATDPAALIPIRETLQALASDTILSSDPDSDTGSSANKYGVSELTNDMDGWSLDGSTKFEDSPETTNATLKDSPIEFLKAWFPFSSEEYLAEALAENPTDDLSQVVENLLSLEMIREAEERGSWGELDIELERELDLERELELGLEFQMEDGPVSAWDFMTQEERDESWMMGTAKRSTAEFADTFASDFTVVSKKKANKKAKAAAGMAGGDLPKQKKQTVVPLAVPTSRPKSSAAQTKPIKQKQMVLLNRWNDFTTTSQTMSTLLSPFPQATPAYFISFLHDPSYDSARSALFGAIDRILSELESMEYPGIEFLMEVLFSSDDIEKNIEEGIKNRSAVEKVWQVCLGEFDRAVEMWAILEGSKQRSVVSVSIDKAPSSHERSSGEVEEKKKTKDKAKKQAEVLPSVVAATEQPPLSRSSSLKRVKPAPPKAAVHDSKPTAPLSAAPIMLTFPLIASAPSRKSGSAPWSNSRPGSPLPRSAPGSRSSSPTRTTKTIIEGNPSAFPLPSPIPKGTKSKAQRTRTTAASVLAAPIGKLDLMAAGEYQPVDLKPSRHQIEDGLGAVGDYETLKRREHEALEKRKEALLQASRLFTSGSKSNRGGEVASHYAEQARRYYNVSRQLSLDVARAKLVCSNRVTATWIDLHGLTAYQALRIVHERVHVWWNSGLSSTSHYSIVTGRGSHSANGRSVLRPAVARSLVNDGWQISLGKEGMILVTGIA